MQCISPVKLWRTASKDVRAKKGKHVEQFPCGRCPACLKRRQGSWIFRLLKEQERSSSSAFVTLTYKDSELPLVDGLPTLDKTHHQLFIKRLRQTIKRHFPQENKIKYYSCGEYGDTTARPHYHSIIFNLPDDFIRFPELVERDWKLGQVMVAPCNAKTIAYVTKYMFKTQYTERTKDEDPRLPEFSLMSKGLGSNYLTERTVKYHKSKLNPYIVITNGDKIPIPRYYKDKMFTEHEKLLLQEKAREHIESNKLEPGQQFDKDITVLAKHKKKQLIQKRELTNEKQKQNTKEKYNTSKEG